MPQYHVFLGYNDKNEADVADLAGRLYGKDITSFYAKWDLVPGESWQPALQKALNASRTTAVSLRRPGIGLWQHTELSVPMQEQAQESSRRVIPAFLPGMPHNESPEVPAPLPTPIPLLPPTTVPPPAQTHAPTASPAVPNEQRRNE